MRRPGWAVESWDVDLDGRRVDVDVGAIQVVGNGRGMSDEGAGREFQSDPDWQLTLTA